ncbi:MAG: hypothetical protein K2H61_01710 [Muribaculaceae bacterium]|nr:hypothetical protein [Muribaculaceae bacterium]
MLKQLNKALTAMIVVVLATVIGVSCRTSQETYRKAYEKAKQKEVESLGGETVYNAIRREARQGATTVNGDSIAYQAEWITVTPDEGTLREALKPYNLVAAQFKQLFHARSMRNRLQEAGYPGAFIVQTREPYYYVVVMSAHNIGDLIAPLRQLEQNPPIKLLEPCPWILKRR